MAACFVADIKLQDKDEVLRLPLLKHKTIRKLWEKGNKHLEALGVDTIHELDDTLEGYLQHAGKFFGKDPTKFEQVGSDKVDVVEEGGLRIIKKTGIYSGIELEIHMQQPFHDERLGKHEDPSLCFNEERTHIKTDEEWKKLVEDQPWMPPKRRRRLAHFLYAKLTSNSTDLQAEGAHAFWELSINKDHHADLPKDRVMSLLDCVVSENLEVARLSAAAIWGLSTSSLQRKPLTDLGVVQTLIRVLQRSLSLTVVPNGTEDPTKVTESQRDDLQAYVLGALSILLVDRNCRIALNALEPNFETLLTLCKDLDGYNETWGSDRRTIACRILTGVFQRDHEVRMNLIEHGRVQTFLELLNDKGCGYRMVQFCMASLLATMVLDDHAMELINERQECHLLFQCCLSLLAVTLESLRPSDESETPKAEADAEEEAEAEELAAEKALSIKLAEGCGQALWGSAYFCALRSPEAIKAEHISKLSEIGLECVKNQTVPLGRVAHSISATLATFCSEYHAAETLMSDPKDATLKTLMFFLSVKDTDVFKGSGHVCAAACTGLAFLACHRLGSKGDECLTGPFREKLLDIGAFGGLLAAALDSPREEHFRSIIEQSAAVGVMYLSTMAGDVDVDSLSDLTTLLNSTTNVEMVEYLMAAMWILLRNPHNRKILSTAFSGNPGNTASKEIHSKLNDAIDVFSAQDALDSAPRMDSPDSTKGKPPGGSETEGNGEGNGNKTAGGEDPESQTLKAGESSNEAHDEQGNKQTEPSSEMPGGTVSKETLQNMKSEASEFLDEEIKTEPSGDGDWGLDTLVRVGENWLPRILHLNVSCDDSDAPLLKLFEFLSASMCLFLVGEGSAPMATSLALFEFGDLSKTKRKGWFASTATLIDIESGQPDLIERALVILTQLLHLTIPRAWKTIQLCCTTLWNITSRSPQVQKRAVELGICIPLLDIVNRETWPASLRNCASGHLQNLAEFWPNLEYMGGQIPFLGSLVLLCNSKVPLLELRGARGIARATYHVPDRCPTPQTTLDECKASVAQQGSINALAALLQRLNRRYCLLKDGSRLLGPKSPLLSDPGDDPSQYEDDMANEEAVMQTYVAVLTALVNISTLKMNQVQIGKRALYTLLGTNCLLAERGGADYKNKPEGLACKLCSAVLQNLSLHPGNRTRMYKAELRGSVALGREIGISDGEEQLFADQDQARAASRPPHPCFAGWSPSPVRTQAGTVAEFPNTIATSCRPKVIFPPILEDKESIVPFLPVEKDAKDDGKEVLISESTNPPRECSPEPSNVKVDKDPSKRFMSWLDATFGEQEARKPSPVALNQTSRLPIVDSEGNWINERPSMRSVNGILQRPLSHVWENPLDEGMKPAERWNPAISEYIEPKSRMQMGPTASKLMQTRGVEIGTGRFSETVSRNRPATCDRCRGRIPLTTLQHHEAETEKTTDAQHKDNEEVQSNPVVPLKVVISPKRLQTVISFEERLSIDSGFRRPHLAVFEHVDGARVSASLFPDYVLPNGKKAFYYYDCGSMINEIEIGPLFAPEPPTSVPAALQQAMPLADVLHHVAKPPGSAPPFVPYKPVPRLVPLPRRHTLPVKYPESLDASTFGDLREDNLQLLMIAKKIVKTEVESTTEKIEVAPQEEREPWTLPSSIFKPRVKESDSKDFFDTPKAIESMFERDWARCCQKEKFTSMLSREAKAVKSDKDEKVIIKEIHNVLKACYVKFVSAFVYYSSTGGGDPYHMSLNSFTSFLDDCEIPDHESPAIKRSDCDTIFIVANFIMDKKSKDNAVNNEQALMRFEFMEALVRIAISKFIKGQKCEDIAEAVQMLMDQNVLPNLPLQATVDPNDFRNGQLYNEEVDILFKKHAVLLKAIYSRYRLKPSGGGLRPKVMKIDGWLQLMEEAQCIDAHFTLQDALLCFLWSRMCVLDEVKDYARYESMTFVDMLEALGRVAELKCIPPMMDIRDAGFESVLEWASERERKGEEGEKSEALFRVRPSAQLGVEKTRALVGKLEGLLDLMCRQIYHDPSQPENEFSSEALLKMIKKIDKDLGP